MKRDYAYPVAPCPTPEKHAYSSKLEARSKLERVRAKFRTGKPGRLDVYRCECGQWHVGHLAANVINGTLTRDQVYRKGKAA